ncbi:MAG: hypothetical protein D6702_01570 [Planctomycetota bacterium]|nr:MAG: hypothetical protein D6702_01570 [Planctomycetota bacterium]
MDQEPRPPEEPAEPPTRVFCRRTEQELPVDEHRRCPYCFGQESEIVSGEHKAFCDFRPGVDPIHFGFPEDAGRDLKA